MQSSISKTFYLFIYGLYWSESVGFSLIGLGAGQLCPGWVWVSSGTSGIVGFCLGLVRPGLGRSGSVFAGSELVENVK